MSTAVNHIKAHLRLQLLMTNRRFRDAGLPPAAAYFLVTAGFTIMSWYLFSKTTYAPYLYLLMAASVTGPLSEKQRNEFLQICFGDKRLRLIRILENVIVAFPFAIFLCLKQYYLFGAGAIIQAMILALIPLPTGFQYSLPTPFSAKPFEFTTGFRNSFFVLAAAYIITLIAIAVNNYNLGLFAMLLVFATVLSYYSKPEEEYHVWIYKLNAKQFLLAKIKTGLWNASCLALPIAILMGCYFHKNVGLLLLLFIVGLAFVACMIVNKYAAFPNDLNIVQVIFLVMSISFPPFLLLLLPFLFVKAKNRLTHLLP